MNTYGYMVVPSKCGCPLHIVEIEHFMFCGFSVFNNSRDAMNYINQEKESLKKYGLNDTAVLKYDPGFNFSKNLLFAYMNSEKLFSKMENRQVYTY